MGDFYRLAKFSNLEWYFKLGVFVRRNGLDSGFNVCLKFVFKFTARFQGLQSRVQIPGPTGSPRPSSIF